MARAIPTSLAPVVEQFELDADVVVTLDRVADVLRITGSNRPPREIAYELQRAGWLGSLRAQGAWEFLPGSRGGAYGSGDRFIEFRAQKQLHPGWPGVLAMESSASLLGFAQRLPEREVVSLPSEVSPPKAFAGQWRVTTVVIGPEGCATIDNLATWNLDGLIVGIAASPAAYRDMPGMGQWLADAVHQSTADGVIHLLKEFPVTVRQRTAYLFAAGGNAKASGRILEAYPPEGVAWFGNRTSGGKFHTPSRVQDTVLHRYLTVGVGA